MRSPITWLCLFLPLGVPVLAVLRYNHEALTPPTIGFGRGEAGDRIKHASEQEAWKQVLSRLDQLEESQQRKRSTYDQAEEDLKSLRVDVDSQSSSMLRMDMFAETMLQRLLVLESKHKGDNTRKRIEQDQASNDKPTKDFQQTSKQPADENSKVSDIGQHTSKKAVDDVGQEPEKAKESPICLATAPPPRDSASVDITLTDTGRVAKYTCKSGSFNIGGDVFTSTCDAAGSWSQVDISCNNLTTCYHQKGGRRLYGGTEATTTSGRTCQKWDRLKPHSHPYESISFSHTSLAGAESIIEVANYCRDPGMMHGSGKLWCYTTNPHKRWEECNIPKCTTT
ncbi:uncharacterized protein LOC124139792 [Haliotis rufescens]|uniref:uncharacterized protein LOC124139792 n=1 Tax=Haliotis rufescens TaxID=6454 RepID=UPI00201EAA7E|nr:uncharacterized protein LOC124139792 [Haliotis rufescens]